MKKSKNIIKFIGLLLVFAIIAIGAVFVYRYTNGLNENFKMYYLNYGDKRIVNERNEMQFNLNTDYRFNVVNTFGSLQGDLSFDVLVQANNEVEFEYLVNGETKSWNDSKFDFTKYFLKKDNKGFTFNTEIKTMSDLMSLVYPEAEIVLPSKLDTSIYPLEIVVTSNGSNTSYRIKFSFSEFISIDTPGVIF